METKDKKLEIITKELIKLNKKFHSRSLLTESFYYQLEKAGFIYKKCILINLFPDSSNTYSGKIIRQDGEVFEFDIDLDSSEHSSFKNINCSFSEIDTKDNSDVLKLEHTLAFNLFHKLKITGLSKELC